MKRAFGFIIGAVMGGVIGAAAALLFAPVSGVDLRSRIEDRTRIFTTDIRQAASSKRIELKERLETLQAPKV